MASKKGAWAGPLLAAVAAFLVAVTLDHVSPAPSADVARGSEEPFAAGLQLREIPPGGVPQRWTGARTLVRFRDVPAGPAALEVAVRGQRSAVAVAFDGVLVGQLAPGQQHASFALVLPRRARHVVELRVDPFVAGDGRSLGALLQSVRLQHAPAGAPSAVLAAEFALPAAVIAAAALAAGLGTYGAMATALTLALLQALLLWPQGLLRSGSAPALGVLLALGALVAAAFARWCERRRGGAGRWAFAALLAAFVVQGVLACSPLMVVSDAVFHANNLTRVARGDLLLTSVTQHAQPFRFPYGVSFYVVLLPFLRAGADAVALVRIGASVSALAASAALFLLLLFRSTAARAGLAVVLLQMLPMTLDVHSHGNLSNVFGQSATAGFFAWWAGGTPGGWPLGAALFVAGSLGHFSSLIVLTVLAVALVVAARRATGRTRAWALAAGLIVTAAYYVQFVPMALEQLPRLLEGGGQGRGVSRGAWSALRLQVLAPLTQWGLPVLVLAWFGRPRRVAEAPIEDPLGRDLIAYWAAGAVLAALAIVSPLEVRYLYALGIPLAAAAGAGAVALASRGRSGRVACTLLAVAQAALACVNTVDAVLRRYR